MILLAIICCIYVAISSQNLKIYFQIYPDCSLEGKKSHVEKCWTPWDIKKLSMAEPGFLFSSHLQSKICSKKFLKESTISPVISRSTKWILSLTKALLPHNGFSSVVKINIAVLQISGRLILT